ncbi:MAG: cell wall hydrolase [Proteobacteria bacterium]|nr:cell wall hydrolase [Pseudomonadota bacterium]
MSTPCSTAGKTPKPPAPRCSLASARTASAPASPRARSCCSPTICGATRSIALPISARSRPVPAKSSPTEPAVNDTELLARVIWGEARGEGEAGMAAVASVIMNRVRRPGWWGNSLRSVCTCPWQFSCLNPGDPNRAKLYAVTAADPIFATALAIAQRAVAGDPADPTRGATHYYAADTKQPSWALGRVPTARIGRHLFYRLDRSTAAD